MKGVDRAHNLAIIEDGFENPAGTGFLVNGGDLCDKFAGETLLLTNAHVISNDPTDRAALPPEKARISFQLLGENATVFHVQEILWCSPKEEFDATLIRLDKPVNAKEAFPVARYLPTADQKQRMYIIGHPKGMKLQFPIKDNVLLAIDDTQKYLHYRAPTEGGSSGSPVFNEDWELIGLHHAGGFTMPRLDGQEGIYAANEGITLQSIQKQIQKP